MSGRIERRNARRAAEALAEEERINNPPPETEEGRLGAKVRDLEDRLAQLTTQLSAAYELERQRGLQLADWRSFFEDARTDLLEVRPDMAARVEAFVKRQELLGGEDGALELLIRVETLEEAGRALVPALRELAGENDDELRAIADAWQERLGR